MNNHDLLPQKNNSNKPLLSSVLFPELKRELEADPSLVGNLQGVFIMTVKGSSTSAAAVDEW